MKSKAQFKSHPIHPMLVDFPIAFFVGAFAFDLIYFLTESEALKSTSVYLIIGGLITGIAAAVAGLIDYMYTVPPHSSGSKRAAKHGLINAGVLVVFGTVLFLKYELSGLRIVLALELTGVVLLIFSGWLGGTLVFRNEIGVDRRYAGAGKWKEIHSALKDGKIEAGLTSDLATDQMKLVHANGKRIVVARTENEYVAFEDRCPHRGGSLAAGAMICGTVQCPWHGSQFDVKTGKLKAGPTEENITVYKVEVKGDRIFIVL